MRRGFTPAMVAVIALLVGFFTFIPTAQPANAADARNFNPGYIISDQLFYNGGAMSAGEVQTFLNAAVPSCRAGYTCLKDYRQATPSRAAVAGRCAAYTGSGNETAAQIITKVGIACGFSQKAMIVLLEKEQGIITDSWPSDRQYRSATGYGCPDTADCDSNYYGFFNQVYAAALQFKNYQANPTRWNHVPGRVNAVRYSPNAACGSSQVYIQNAATAGLYNYTPYQPNPSALANLYGTGDGCGAYGNRNFWRMYTDWFGSTTDAPNPVGVIDEISAAAGSSNGSLTVRGWTFDANQPSRSIEAHVYVTYPDGSVRGTPLQANGSRPDVGNAYPGAGAAHGYSTKIPVDRGGTYQVCVYGIGLSGNNRVLGCQATTIEQNPPKGSWDDFTTTGTGASTALNVRGWTFDPDVATAVNEAHVYVTTPDGRTVGTAQQANKARPDVGAAYPGAGAAHGWEMSIPATAAGTYKVCVYGIGKYWKNVGANPSFGCRSTTLVSAFPSGSLDDVSFDLNPAAPALNVRGWTFDAGASASSIPAHIYVTGPDGQTTGYGRNADKPRDDVNRVFGITGSHGFQESIPLTKQGKYTVCVYGIAVSPLSVGKNTQLACRTITTAAVPPIGWFDSATVSADGSVAVNGWAVDQQVASMPIQVHFYITRPDGSVRGIPYTAGATRADVAAVYPWAGPTHGFAETFKLDQPGTSQICAIAIGTAWPSVGSNTSLGCKSVRY
ncbi:hypothetical protein [Plantibacter sp. CFBP 13570]|uniref:hypothetical protein n=1 Tax=Plantibacter sp. CFBP 13570 TaxID=2775272 RepID=UPI001930990E|nr:hypothetical protein [Plantibacter sp. CFBP 13570]MBD8533860.1 hypothetical protein [Plantibacter sp. CFBP 13570]